MLIQQSDQIVPNREVHKLKSLMHRPSPRNRSVRRWNKVEVVHPIVNELGAAKSHDQPIVWLIEAEPTEVQVRRWSCRETSHGSIRRGALRLPRVIEHARQDFLTLRCLHGMEARQLFLYRRMRGIRENLERSLIERITLRHLSRVIGGFGERQHCLFGKLAVKGNHEDSLERRVFVRKVARIALRRRVSK